MQNMRGRIGFHWMAAVAAVALGTLVLSPVVVMAQGDSQVTRTSSTGLEAAATQAYWTPERMAAAVPMDMARPNTGAIRMAAQPAASGTPSRAAGGYSAETGQMNKDITASPDSIVPLDGAYPGPNDTFYYKQPYTKTPIKTVGKLFFTDPRTGGGFQCTASVTIGNTAVKNVIWTAGHCVANGGQSYFYTNFQFCPEYKNGVAPIGCWAWNGNAAVFTVWFASGDLTRDEGVIALNHTGTVKLVDVGKVTGGLGFAWNWGRDQHWHHFGYPCVNWDCVEIVETDAEHRYDVNIGGSGPFVNSWGSGQTEGSSGSAVILFFSYSGGFINSNVSFYFSSGPNGNEHGIEIQGPYYDSTVCGLWKSFTGWTGTC